MTLRTPVRRATARSSFHFRDTREAYARRAVFARTYCLISSDVAY